MSELGQQRTSRLSCGMSGLSPRTDIVSQTRNVRKVPTLLGKSVTADGCPSAIRLLTTGFDLPALTLVRQLQRYAMVAHAQAMPTYGDSERCQRGQFVPGTSRPAQSEPTKLQDALQVGVEI